MLVPLVCVKGAYSVLIFLLRGVILSALLVGNVLFGTFPLC